MIVLGIILLIVFWPELISGLITGCLTLFTFIGSLFFGIFNMFK